MPVQHLPYALGVCTSVLAFKHFMIPRWAQFALRGHALPLVLTLVGQVPFQAFWLGDEVCLVPEVVLPLCLLLPLPSL